MQEKGLAINHRIHVTWEGNTLQHSRMSVSRNRLRLLWSEAKIAGPEAAEKIRGLGPQIDQRGGVQC